MQGDPFSVGPREGPFAAFRPLIINQTPDVKPFFSPGFGSVERKATVARHCERAREYARDLTKLGECIQPLPNTLVLTCIATQFHAMPLLLIQKVDAKIGLRAWGDGAYAKAPKKHVGYFSVSDRTTLVGSGPGENEVYAEELLVFRN